MYINALWLVFTLAGLGVFGIFPATISMFAVTRKWVMGEEDIPIFRTFWLNYRREFINSQILGFLLVFIGIVLYVDFYFFSSPGTIYLIAKLVILSASMMYGLLLLYVFPLFVHVKLKSWQYLKYSLMLSIYHLFRSLFMLAGCVGIIFFLLTFSGFIPLLGGSGLALWMTWIAHQAFRKSVPFQRVQGENTEAEEPV
nr:YesL family protein [Paenactinomyces guangxiensis]